MHLMLLGHCVTSPSLFVIPSGPSVPYVIPFLYHFIPFCIMPDMLLGIVSPFFLYLYFLFLLLNLIVLAGDAINVQNHITLFHVVGCISFGG